MGGDSKFENQVIAKGGNRETGGSATQSLGAVKFSGGDGGSSRSSGGAGGGGSAGAAGHGGTGGNSNSTSGALGGTAGAGGGAVGGNGGNNFNSGGNGEFPGGGGGEKGDAAIFSGSGAGGHGQVIITYSPAYLAEIISADTGSSTWCPGETRKVSVTIKNIGTQPWTDEAGRDFNIGVKWNTNGGNWNDYHVRVDAQNLRPGETKTYTFTIQASNNQNQGYTTPLATGINNISFDIVKEGIAWFGNNPAGTTGVGPGNVVFTTENQTIGVPPLSNNNLNYTYGTFGTRNATANENGNAILTAPPTGSYFAVVNFASYGTPTGATPNFLINLSCHSETSQSVAENYLLGNTGSVTIPATNSVFDDPCVGTGKRLYVLASYATPVCSGTTINIIGTTPTGGNGSYSYQWERSTTSATAGFAAEVGKTGRDYSGIVTTNTWFRRIVSSCNLSTISAVVLVKVNDAPTIAIDDSATSSCIGSAGRPPALSYRSTTGSPTKYSITWTSTPANTFAAVVDAILPAGSIPIIVPGDTAAGTYTGTLTVKNDNGCISSSKNFTITVNDKPTIGTISAFPALCAGVLYQSPFAPSVFSHGSAAVSQGWEISTTPGGSMFIPVSFPYTAALADNGKIVRYTATNSCGTGVSNTIVLIVNDKPSVGSIALPPSFCAGSELNPLAPKINMNGAAINSAGWEVESSAGNNVYTPRGLPFNVVATDNGKRIRYYATNSCGTAYSNLATIFVKPKNTVELSSAAGTNNQTICEGADLRDITFNTTGATNAEVSGLPAGLSGRWASDKVTISGKPSEVGTFNYTVSLIGGCGIATATGTITVTQTNTVTLTSALDTNNQQICAATAIEPITYRTSGATGILQSGVGGVNGLPAGVSAVWGRNTITITGTPIVTGIFNYSIPLVGGCGTAEATGIIKVGLDSVYDGKNWSIGRPVDNGLNAVIASSYNTLMGNIQACNCTVESGSTLTIAADSYVEILNNLTINGTLIVESDGNLVQWNNRAVNTGNILVKRAMTFRSNERKEYNYLISPTENTNLKTEMYRKTDGNAVAAPFVLYHNETNNFFYNSSGAYIKGRSLAVKEPLLNSGAETTAFFKGKPFNGIVNYALAYSGANLGYNLVGNPYPSNLDLNSLFKNNITEIGSTFRFWDNTVNGDYEQQGSTYKGNAYAIYNAAAGINGTGLPAPGKGAAAPGFPGNVGTKVPNQIAKIGQGFMVKALATGKILKYSNAARLSSNTDAVFFGKAADEDRFWLALKAPSGITSTIAVVYFDGGNNAFGMDDSSSVGGSDVLYSYAEQEKVAINGRSTFSSEDKINLGSSHFAQGLHTIALREKEGVFSNGQNIYLKDMITGIITNLTQGDYTFEAQAGEFPGRFEIIYKPESVLGTDSSVKAEVQVYRAAGDFVVKAPKRITSLEIYDMSGRLIHAGKPNVSEYTLSGDSMANGVYLMNIKQGMDQTVKKIVK